MTATESQVARPIDMDNHYYEPLDCFSRYIEPKYRDRAIQVVTVGDNPLPRWAMGDRANSFVPFASSEMIPPPGAFADVFTGDAEPNWDTMINPADYPDLIERQARINMLDEQGLDAALMIPTAAIVCEYDFRDQPDALCANFRAFNRWLEQDWGYGAAGQIYGVPILTLVDRDWAIEELERIAALGARCAYVMMGPINGRSPADPYFDPFWARVEETGIYPVFHIAYEGFVHLYGVHWGEDPHRSIVEYSPFQHCICWGERIVADHFAALVLHNLFGRFPGIKVLSVENGSAWVGPLMRIMDKSMKLAVFSDGGLGGKLTDRPSEILREHVYINPYHEDDIVGLVELIGADRVLFGSDYPHPEGLAKPLQFMDRLEGLGDDVVRKIMRSNAAHILGVTPATA